MANDKRVDEFLKRMGLDSSPIMLQNPDVPENAAPSAPAVQEPVQEGTQQATAAGLLSQFAEPRAANKVAPKIQVPQGVDNSEAITKMEDQLKALQDNYKKDLQDAEDRKFKSEIWAAIGNSLPGVVAGATAMNTKAAVQVPNIPKVVASDPTARVDSKYKTDYEGLLEKYKALKGGQLSPKDMLYANIAQGQLDAKYDSLNTNIENTDRNAGIRVGNAVLADQGKQELSEKQIESLAGYDDTLTSLTRIAQQKKKIDTGPFADKRNRVASYLGVDDPEVTSLRSEVIDTLAAKIKALSGTAANESEVKRLEVTLPGINDSDDVFNRKLKDAEVRIKEARKIREDHFRTKQGKNVKGYVDPKKPQAAQSSAPSSPAGTVRIQGPSGQVATVSAEAAEKYLSKPGYKKVD